MEGDDFLSDDIRVLSTVKLITMLLLNGSDLLNLGNFNASLIMQCNLSSLIVPIWTLKNDSFYNLVIFLEFFHVFVNIFFIMASVIGDLSILGVEDSFSPHIYLSICLLGFMQIGTAYNLLRFKQQKFLKSEKNKVV